MMMANIDDYVTFGNEIKIDHPRIKPRFKVKRGITSNNDKKEFKIKLIRCQQDEPADHYQVK